MLVRQELASDDSGGIVDLVANDDGGGRGKQLTLVREG